MTSLDASGFSITLLKASSEMLAAVDASTSAVGWPQTASNFQPYSGRQILDSAEEQTDAHPSITSGPTSVFLPLSRLVMLELIDGVK